MTTWSDLQAETAGWDECLAIVHRFEDRYALTDEQLFYLYRYAMKVPADGLSMELGICNGKTASVFAYAAKKRGFEAHGIDAFILENSVAGINAAMAQLELPYTVHYGLTGTAPIPGRPEVSRIPWDRPVDLLLIDGSHTNPWVSDDIDRWTPLVKSGGVAMFHDYDGHENPASAHVEVRRAVDRYTTSGWHMEFFINGLMIKRRL